MGLITYIKFKNKYGPAGIGSSSLIEYKKLAIDQQALDKIFFIYMFLHNFAFLIKFKKLQISLHKFQVARYMV